MSISGIRKYVKSFRRVNLVAIEATTGSANFPSELKLRIGWVVKQCYPGYVNRMKNNPDKSDKSDSHLLSDLNRVGYPPEVWLTPEGIRDLRALVRYREQQVKERTRIKLRIHAILREHRLKASKEFGTFSKLGLAWLLEIAKELPEHSSWILIEHVTRTIELNEAEQRVNKRLKYVASKNPLTTTPHEISRYRSSLSVCFQSTDWNRS